MKIKLDEIKKSVEEHIGIPRIREGMKVDEVVRMMDEFRKKRDAEDNKRKPRITKYGRIEIKNNDVKVEDFTVPGCETKEELFSTIIDYGIKELLKAKKLILAKKTGIERYTDAIRSALVQENWFSALFISLAMPNICAKIEWPSKSGDANPYKDWVRENFQHKYPEKLFNAEDCWKLRCRILHQARSDKEFEQEFQFERVVFTEPHPVVQMNQCYAATENGSFVLQLQVDIFCEDMCSSVLEWFDRVKDDEGVQQRISELLEIKTYNQKIFK